MKANARAAQLDACVVASHKSRQKNEGLELLRIVDQVQARQNDTVVERRKRLAELLLREREAYEGMLSHLTETDEQRRERLLAKARALREKREAEKQKETARCNDRMFREKIDVLRQAESRLRVMQVADSRFDQIEASKRKKEEEAADESYFNQQAAEAQRRACDRAREDEENIYKRNEQMKSDLNAQVEGNRMRAELAKEQERRDNEEFYRLLHEEQVAEAQKQLARKARSKEIAEEMKALTRELENARRQEFEQLRLKDKEELEKLLADLAEERRQAAEEKRRNMEKNRKNMDDLKEDIKRRQEKEESLDELWKEANDKEWEKRERIWRADQEKRDRLMHNILTIRRQQVYEDRARKKMERLQARREDQEFLDSLPPDDAAERRKKRLEEMAELQAYLDMQIGERKAAKLKELEEKRNMLSQEQSLHAEYRDRIAQEMQNLERAKPERYRHVPLLDPRVKNIF